MLILLADDHPLFREGVKPVLNKLDPALRIIEAVDYPSAFAAMRAAQDEIELALLDLNMPGLSGVDGIRQFRAEFPDTPLIVLSAADCAEEVRQILTAGAMGYISKASSSEVILNAIRLVMVGGVYAPPELVSGHGGVTPVIPASARTTPEAARIGSLTERQIEVLSLLKRGLSNRQIADHLAVTEGTVKIHVAAIFRVMGVTNRTEAVLMAQKAGIA